MKLRVVFLLILFFAFYLSVSAQYAVVLEKCNFHKIVKYQKGQRIHILCNDSLRSQIHGKITGLNDSCIFVDWTNEVNIKNIYALKRAGFWISLLSQALMQAGISYFAFDAINNIIRWDTPIINSETALISSIVIGAGAIIKVLSVKKCKIAEKKWKIKIIETGARL